MRSSRAHAVPLRLIDGPLVNIHRAELVARMAADLITYDAAGDENNAIRSLYGTRRYEMVDIVMLIDDARQAAMQKIVAREMAKP